MRLKIETIAALVPSVRAEIARELAGSGMSQQDIAEALGVSQPAVSQYIRQLRGASRRDDFVRAEVSKICAKILGGRRSELEDDIYSLCKSIADNRKSI